MKKTVSVVIPAYNAEKYIIEAIASVRAQTFQDWELLLVEDGSSDNTYETIEEYRKMVGDNRIRVIRQENMGAAKARNRGVMEAEGCYIAYLDSDDIWLPDKLRRQLAFMEEKSAAFAFTGYEFADSTGKGSGKIVRVPPMMRYREALKNTAIFTTTVMFNTEKIGKELLQMPEVKSEDTALWWKVLRSGYIAYGLDENLALYRRPGKSLSSNKIEAVRRIWKLYRVSEKLSVPRSLYYFCFWALRAVQRRI